MDNSFEPDIEEINYFVAAVAVTGAALTAFSGTPTIRNTLYYLTIGACILLTREIGQRTIAYWMKADTELHLSTEGSAVTILGTILALLYQLPIILLFPIYNTFSIEKHKHWGRQIDAMWLKRKFNIVTGGITALLIGWLISYALISNTAAQAYAIFTLYQLMPFDYDKIPTGALDGSIILKQNGLKWLTLMIITLTTLGLTFI